MSSGEAKRGEAITLGIRKFYEEYSFPSYDRIDSPAALVEKARKSVFADRLHRQIPSGARILEVGCGTVQMSIFLSMADREVVGMDMSCASLRMGQDFVNRFTLQGIRFVQASVFDFPVKPERFDLVYCSGVLHHTKDPEGAFAIILSALKPGGYVILGLYNTYGRLPTDLRRLVFRLTGGRGRSLDHVIRRKGLDPEKALVWYMDQYRNPHESKHSVDEVLAWFRRYGVEYVNAVPPIRPGAGGHGTALFAREKPGGRLAHLFCQLKWIFTIGREGALFLMIGRKSRGT